MKVIKVNLPWSPNLGRTSAGQSINAATAAKELKLEQDGAIPVPCLQGKTAYFLLPSGKETTVPVIGTASFQEVENELSAIGRYDLLDGFRRFTESL